MQAESANGACALVVVCHALLVARKGALPVGKCSEFRGLGRKWALLGTRLACAWRDSVLCLASISGAYFESPRRYLSSLCLQGRAPLTLITGGRLSLGIRILQAVGGNLEGTEIMMLTVQWAS